MRVFVLVVLMVLAGLAFPRSARAAGCDAEVSACLSSEIVMSVPEDWDLLGCYGDYLECVFRLIRST